MGAFRAASVRLAKSGNAQPRSPVYAIPAAMDAMPTRSRFQRPETATAQGIALFSDTQRAPGRFLSLKEGEEKTVKHGIFRNFRPPVRRSMKGNAVLRPFLNQIPQSNHFTGGPMNRVYSRFAPFLLALLLSCPFFASAQATSAAAPPSRRCCCATLPSARTRSPSSTPTTSGRSAARAARRSASPPTAR